MYITNQVQALSYNVRLRNLFVLFLFVSMLINLLLAFCLISRDRTTILLPNVISGPYQITQKTLSANYVEDIARDVVTTILNRTPNNIEYITSTILKIAHPASYGVLKVKLTELGETIQQKRVTTAFYPSSISLDKDGLTAFVHGDLHTYVGQVQTSKEQKIYKIGFSYENGKLFLRKFIEHKIKVKNNG